MNTQKNLILSILLIIFNKNLKIFLFTNVGLFWTIVLISERNIAKRLLSLKILQDSDFSIHFIYDNDKKSENISILHFLWQFYDKHVKYEVFQTSFFIILKIIFN